MDIQTNMENKIIDASLSEYLRKRYPDREKCSDMRQHMLKDLIVKLHIYEFNTIGQIEQALARTKIAFELLEKDYPPSKLVDSKYSAEAIVWLSMQLLYDDFPAFDFEQSVVDVLDPFKLAEYRKHILPEEN